MSRHKNEHPSSAGLLSDSHECRTHTGKTILDSLSLAAPRATTHHNSGTTDCLHRHHQRKPFAIELCGLLASTKIVQPRVVSKLHRAKKLRRTLVTSVGCDSDVRHHYFRVPHIEKLRVFGETTRKNHFFIGCVTCQTVESHPDFTDKKVCRSGPMDHDITPDKTFANGQILLLGIVFVFRNRRSEVKEWKCCSLQRSITP